MARLLPAVSQFEGGHVCISFFETVKYCSALSLLRLNFPQGSRDEHFGKVLKDLILGPSEQHGISNFLTLEELHEGIHDSEDGRGMQDHQAAHANGICILSETSRMFLQAVRKVFPSGIFTLKKRYKYNPRPNGRNIGMHRTE
jgi:hypothetical protein